MTHRTRIRRMGWLAVLPFCFTLYGVLHLKVTAVESEVVVAERQIIALEEGNLLLETEFLTRSNQMRLSAWNRVDFGFVAPTAAQFIENERQLASFGGPRSVDAPAPIMLAGMTGDEELPEFPKLVSPLTGEPLDPRLLSDAPGPHAKDTGEVRIALTSVVEAPVRIALSARAGDASR